MSNHANNQYGLSLIEVLISLVVLSVGLLGIAGMQATGLRNNHSAYTKTQASALAVDMADRIRANAAAAANYVGLDTANSASFPAPTATNCKVAATNCSPAEMAIYDKFQWSRPIVSATAPLLPGGRGRITQTDTAAGIVFTVTLFWLEPGYQGTRDDCDGNAATTVTSDTACLAMSFQL